MKALFVLVLTTIFGMLVGNGQLVGVIPTDNGTNATITVDKMCINVGYMQPETGLYTDRICDHGLDEIDKIVAVGAGDYIHLSVEKDFSVYTYILQNPKGFGQFEYQPEMLVFIPAVVKAGE